MYIYVQDQGHTYTTINFKIFSCACFLIIDVIITSLYSSGQSVHGPVIEATAAFDPHFRLRSRFSDGMSWKNIQFSFFNFIRSKLGMRCTGPRVRFTARLRIEHIFFITSTWLIVFVWCNISRKMTYSNTREVVYQWYQRNHQNTHTPSNLGN